MQALDRKLIRDFRRLWAQALAIALVLACGVAILQTSFGMSRALEDTRAAYYERNRFADVFAAARRVPLSLMPEIEAIDGVWAAEARTTGDAVLDLPGRVETAVGRIISIPVTGEGQLNLPLLRSGRMPDPASTTEVAVNEPFAEANGFLPGDVFHANLNGQKRPLTITGTVLSPEFIYTIGPGALLPDNEGFGIIWMPEPAVAAAFDMTGAFNSLSLKLTATANAELVIDAVDDLLDAYGGLGAHDRSLQQSDAFLDAEITQLRSMAYILPPIFFGISAFLVNMVVGRIIQLERSEIGLLKAIGYSNVEVCLHYLMLAGLIAAGGILVGWVTGHWLSKALAWQFARFYEFPFLIYRLSYDAFFVSGTIGLATAVIGAARAALQAARLAPAVAMAPPAPPRFTRSLLDRALSALRVSQPSMMILRSFMRWPVRAGLTTLGLSLAVAVLVAASFLDEALDEIIDSAFYQSNRQDVMLLFAQDLPETALEDIRRLPGILQLEGQQYAAAILRNGHLSKRIAIDARRPDPDLARVVNDTGQTLNAPAEGLLLAERLADQLEVGPGDVLEVEFLSGRRETHRIPVAGTATSYFGLGAYMDLGALNRLFRQSPQISIANATLDGARTEALHAAMKDIPSLTGTVMLTDTRASFQKTVRENVLIMSTIYTTIAVLITVGVTYNGARIQLSERARELASLRILGFGRAEVSYILMGESMALALLAQPLGWLLGSGIAWSMTSSFTSDLYAIPLVLKPATFAIASLVVLSAAFASSLLVRRRLDRLDLVAVMKTRE